MDPVSHILSGAALAKSFRAPRRDFWVMAVLAELPDIDVFFGFLGLKGPVFFHRSWTHSFFAAFLFGMTAWVLFGRDSDGFCRRTAYLSVCAAHVLGDWMTSYGTPLLWPLTLRNFSLDWISNLSLVPLAVLAGGLFLAKVWKLHERLIFSSIWVTLAMFIVGSIGLQARAEALVKNDRPVWALPDLLNPLSWRVISRNSSLREYHAFMANPLSGSLRVLGAYPMPPESPWVEASLKNPRVQLFLKHNRWPVAKLIPRANGATVEWGNLLFFWGNHLRGKLIVDLDASGSVISVHREFEPWES